MGSIAREPDGAAAEVKDDADAVGNDGDDAWVVGGLRCRWTTRDVDGAEDDENEDTAATTPGQQGKRTISARTAREGLISWELIPCGDIARDAAEQLAFPSFDWSRRLGRFQASSFKASGKKETDASGNLGQEAGIVSVFLRH